jgi:transcription initiation factor IIF auxiliary subunit
MVEDFELFPGKNLSGLFEDIYNNQTNKKRHISEVIAELRKLVRNPNDMRYIGPLIKDLIDTSVRNDESLLKLATIAQRIMVAGTKSEGEAGFLSDAEREQLLAEIEQVQDEIERVDNMENEIEEVKKKLEK